MAVYTKNGANVDITTADAYGWSTGFSNGPPNGQLDESAYTEFGFFNADIWWSDFNFSIPTNETIVGIEVVVRARRTVYTAGSGDTQLWMYTGTDTGSNFEYAYSGNGSAYLSPVVINSNTLFDYVLGGPSVLNDVLGGYTPSNINASGFYVALEAYIPEAGTLGVRVEVDAITVNVYTSLGAAAFWAKKIYSSELIDTNNRYLKSSNNRP